MDLLSMSIQNYTHPQPWLMSITRLYLRLESMAVPLRLSLPWPCYGQILHTSLVLALHHYGLYTCILGISPNMFMESCHALLHTILPTFLRNCHWVFLHFFYLLHRLSWKVSHIIFTNLDLILILHTLQNTSGLHQVSYAHWYNTQLSWHIHNMSWKISQALYQGDWERIRDSRPTKWGGCLWMLKDLTGRKARAFRACSTDSKERYRWAKNLTHQLPDI